MTNNDFCSFLNLKCFLVYLNLVLPYMGYIGMCHCEGYGFQAVFSRIRYINQSVWVQNRVPFFKKLISWLKILSRLGIVVIRFCFGQNTVLMTSVVSGKQLLQDRGDLGLFTLVQGSKIQLNQLWYRLRVLGSQRHIPTQKFLKYPPTPGKFPRLELGVKFDETNRFRFHQQIEYTCTLICQ